MTISVQTPRSGPYAGDGSTVAFAYTFQIDADAELVVQVRNTSTGAITTKTLTTDYTVSGAGNPSGGTVTFGTAPTASEEVAITRDIDIEQTVDLQNRGVVDPEVLEDLFDDFTRIIQTLDEEVGRSVKVDAFDSTDIDSLLVDIAVLSGISANISTVAGISGDVTTVAGISANVTTVAGIQANVTTVAGISSDVTTVAGDSADIQTLADIEDGTVATNAISGLAAISTDVTTVAGISADVTTVAGIDTDVTTVAGISANVTTVAGISANVTTVAGISADVTTVAGISSDVTTVASISADVTALAAGTGGTLTGDWTASGVWDFTSTEALRIPVGTTAQRPGTPATGDLRFNSTTTAAELYNGSAWAPVGGGGVFKGENGEVGSAAALGDIFRVHEQELNTDTTIDADENALAAGPLTIASGTTLTVTSGGNLSIV